MTTRLRDGPSVVPPRTAVGVTPILRPVMPELDAVRGVAVLLVLFYHGFFWSNNQTAGHSLPMKALLIGTRPGWLGVELFFVLSGFLITNILIGARDRRDFYQRFYTRRALRILPAYVALIILLLATRAIGWKFALVSSVFLANVSTYLNVPLQYTPLWSLAVEEHFYLTWPTAVRHLSERVLILVAGTIIVVEPLVRLTAFRTGRESYGPTWFMLDGLAFGALLALVIRRTREDRRVLSVLASICAAGGMVMFAAGVPYGIVTRNRPLGAALQVTPFYLLFTSILGALLLWGSSPQRKAVQVPFLAFFGQISYGLYLIHLFVFGQFDTLARLYWPHFAMEPRDDRSLLVRFIVCGALSTAIAYISRWTLEEYFLRIKDRGGKQRAGEREALSRPSRADAAAPQRE